MNNNFKFVMPAELQKSDDGDWKIAGLASTEDIDQQGETIIQKGIDLTPIDQGRGWFNFDHASGIENLVGTIDGYKQDEKGLYVHGKLFKNHDKAKAIYQVMSSLGENTKSRVGLSVEGKILERDAINKSVIKKCQIDKVAITLNPVNSNTYADLVKSMSNANIEFNSTKENNEILINNEQALFTANQVIEIVKKALSTGGAQNGSSPSGELTGGAALGFEELEKDIKEVDKKSKIKTKKMKKMDKKMYKSNMLKTLDKIQVLYPDYSRSELWEALKHRLERTFPEITEDFSKGGPGSGKRGHKTNSNIRQDHINYYVEKYNMKHPEGMREVDLKAWYSGAGLTPAEVKAAMSMSDYRRN